jgi:hypothetical protein
VLLEEAWPSTQTVRPNPRLQRTRWRSPLSRQPLGGRKLLLSAFASLLLGAGVLLSCATAVRSSPDYAKALTLSIKPASGGGQIGESIEVRFVLENVSAERISACLTERKGHTWRGPADLKQQLGVVDHNFCQSPFVLGAGQTRAWSEEVAVLDVGFGEATLQAWVQVVDQRSCDRYGCDGRYIYSNQAPFHVILF